MPPRPIMMRFSRAASIICSRGSGGGRLAPAVFHQFQSKQQTHAAHVADQLVLILQVEQFAAQIGARFFGVA